MTTFVQLNNRYEISLRLESAENLHVGSGLEGLASDAGFLTRNGKAYVPGSSLRGVLRSTVERILNSFFPKPIACTLFEKGNDPSLCDVANEPLRKQIERGEEELKKLCPVCSLFGSTLMGAKIKVTDALQPGESVGWSVRDGVGIDRDTGTAKEAIKFTYDVLDPKAVFEGKLIVENAEDDDFALLHVMLAELKRGVHMGGKKSRGLGLVTGVVTKVQYLDPSLLVSYFETGEAANLPEGQFRQKNLEAFQEFVKARAEAEV